MSSGNLTWEQASLHVLKEAGEPLHYTEIGDRIAKQTLTRSVGANPAAQANAALHKLFRDGSVQKVDRGLFATPEVARQVAEADAEDDEAIAGDPGRLTVNAYGLHWSRSLVDWEATTNGRLLGNAGSTLVNFADQDGIYLLHTGNEVVYAGQSRTPNSKAGLFGRLRSHHTDYRKTDRWDTFSWFGFRPVDNETTDLLSAPETATIGDVINVIEAIFIEGLMPRLNMRAGEDTKDWLKAKQYFQVEDPALIARRFAALSQVGQALR